MSGVRFEADRMSVEKIEAVAGQLRSMFALDEPYLPVVNLLEELLPTALGDRFHLTVEGPKEMGNRHGYVDPRTGELCLREDVYLGVHRHVGRDRFTACHEIGHYFLHRGVLNRASTGASIPAYRDPEWQANAFAAAILMPREHLDGLSTASHVAAEFGVSLEAAKLRMKKLGLIRL